MLKKPALRYTGGGHRGWLPGVPARDLSEAEVAAYGGETALVASGLYVKGTEDKRAAGPRETKQAAPDVPATDETPADEAAKEG